MPFDAAWFAELLVAGSSLPRRDIAATPAVSGNLAAADPTGAEVSRQDWADAPDPREFVGRVNEIATLREWVVDERCRVVALLGLGGIGKTTLATRLARDLAPSFELVYWRSLRLVPSVSEWLDGAIGFLSGYTLVPPESQAERISMLVRLLRERRYLLVLDNLDALLEPGDCEGRFRDGHAGYGRLLEAIGERQHQSCSTFTSREAPPDFGLLGSGQVRALELGGLSVAETQAVLSDKQLSGSELDWEELVARHGGNGLALKMAGETIRQVFGGDISAFLLAIGTKSTVYGSVRRLMASQLDQRVSVLEQELLRVLAVVGEPVTPAKLMAHLSPRIGRGAVIEALQALRRRSLVQQNEPGAGIRLQPVVLDYVAVQLEEQVAA